MPGRASVDAGLKDIISPAFWKHVLFNGKTGSRYVIGSRRLPVNNENQCFCTNLWNVEHISNTQDCTVRR